jgi:anti-sigma regulatory factor (Ser/Thr protein kinase)
MSGEPARRTPTGRALRLVGPDDTADIDASLVLSPERQSVAVGRHWVVRIAADAGVTGMANQVVELLTSELLANAVLHGAAGRAIHLHFHGNDDVARVAVGDSVPDRPVVLHPELVAPSGRGMAIVEAMSNRWGVDAQEDGGKVVWFEIDLDDY